MIQNKQLRIDKSELGGEGSPADIISRAVGGDALRWYVARAAGGEMVVEATVWEGGVRRLGGGERAHYPNRNVVLSVVPTGIGCSIGGYAGDAAPATGLLAAAADCLITNPNAVNASDFINLDASRVVYTDGYCIDLFCQGLVDLHLPYANRVGLVVEKAEGWKLDVIFNVLNTVRAVHGVNVTDYVITDEPIGGRCFENQSGAFAGTVDNPRVLFEACERLLARGVNAIAITSSIADLPLENYAKHFAGQYPNPIGGVEAVISYSVTNRFGVPSAHAPLINIKQLDLAESVVDARGAGEMTSTSGLACVLIGLRRAPQIAPGAGCRVRDVVNVNNLMAVVLPAGALGGIPAIYAQKFGVPVIAVSENRTVFDVTADKLGLDNVIEVRSYAEAAGVLLALRQGISLESIARPLNTLRHSAARAASDAAYAFAEATGIAMAPDALGRGEVLA